MAFNDVAEKNLGKIAPTKGLARIIKVAATDIESFANHSDVHLKLKVKALGRLFLHFLTEEDRNLTSMQLTATISGGKFYYSTTDESYLPKGCYLA